MKNSKQKQELIDSIKEMEDVYNDAETPADIKNSLEPSIKNAKGQLKELEQAEQQEQVTVTAEKKVPKTAIPVVKKKKAAAKKKAATTVRKVKKRITQKLPSIRAVIAKAKAELTKVKGRTPRGKEADASRKALPPGTRISKAGKPYREYRENRADLQRKKVPFLAAGGTVDAGEAIEITFQPEQVNVFGYQTKYLPKEVADEFKKAVDAIEAEPDKESMYYHNTSGALKEFANMSDTIFLALSLEAVNMKMLIRATLLSGIYNYKSGMHISIDTLVLAMTKVLEESGKSFARGGDLPDNDNSRTDRLYQSMNEFVQGIEAIADDIHDKDDKEFLLTASWGATPDSEEAYEELFERAMASIAALNNYPLSDVKLQDDLEFVVNELKRSLSTMAHGGRIKSALNRDRKYKSDEPWEKKYHRKTQPLNPRYAASGKRLYPKTFSYNYKEGSQKIVFSVEDETGNEIWTDQFANAQDDQANYGPTRRKALEHYHMEGIRDTKGIKKHLLEHGLIQEHDAVVLGHMLMSKGGKIKKKASFKDKVKAIKKRLSGTKVPAKYQKQYGKKYNKKEADQAARRIAGASRKKDKAFLGMTLINSIDNTLVASSQGAAAM